jgi:hypothetical protein
MTEEETFDIYGDDGDVIPSSPSQQSGPKKRLRRERSSSAPPLTKLDDEDDDRSSTPRGKKVKEEEDDDDQDPFVEYDNVHPLLPLESRGFPTPVGYILGWVADGVVWE